MFNGIWAVALVVSLYFRKKMFAHLVTIYQKAKNTLQWFPGNWKNTSRTPEPHLWCSFGRTIYGRQKHNRKNPQSPNQETQPRGFRRAMNVQRQVSLPWVEIHGESTCPASSGSCRVYVLKPHPPTGEHETCKLKFDSGMFLVVAFGSLSLMNLPIKVIKLAENRTMFHQRCKRANRSRVWQKKHMETH